MTTKKTSATPTALKTTKAKPPIKVPPHKKAEKSKATISEVKKIVPNTGLEMFQLLRECGLLLTTYAKQDYTLDRKKRASLLGFSLVGVSEQVRKQNLINAKKSKGMKHETTTQPVPLKALQAFFKLEIEMKEFIPIVKETIHGIALHKLRHTSDPLFNDKHYFWLKEFLEVLEVEAQTTTTEPHTA